MKIYDEADNEITEDEVDTSKGRLVSDKKFVAHHDAVEAKDEEKHYRVKTIYFEDSEPITIEGDNVDSHIQIEDAKSGRFLYVDQGENRTFRGMDLEEVIESEKQEAAEAYDEYEDIQRYKLFTEEELKTRQEQQEKAQKQQEFMENGPDTLAANTESINDLYVTLADVVAGSGE